MTKENTNKPYLVEIRKGKRYFVCSCKLTKIQPFCDGSHINTDAQPHMYVGKENKEVYFCGCKLSQDFPFCDGSHNNLNN